MNPIKCAAKIIVLSVVSIGVQAQNKVNLVESLKPAGIPVIKFENPPLLNLTEYNFQDAAISHDLKYVVVSRQYPRGETAVKDIVAIKVKSGKETVLLDTLSMIRYGRPNGELYSITFNNQDQLVAEIGNGMDGYSTLTFDVEKKELLKDEYKAEYEEGEEGDEEDTLYQVKIDDLKRIFPAKTEAQLEDISYKLYETDTAGYLVQGILPRDNSILFLPHSQGKLKLLHNVTDPNQNDMIDGVWGTRTNAFYLLKDKKTEYFLKYDIKTNVVTLLEKYPFHSHYTYIEKNKIAENDYLINFEVEARLPEAKDVQKLFRYTNGTLYYFDEYPMLQEVRYQKENNVLFLYYMKDGKHCLDVRSLNP